MMMMKVLLCGWVWVCGCGEKNGIQKDQKKNFDLPLVSLALRTGHRRVRRRSGFPMYMYTFRLESAFFPFALIIIIGRMIRYVLCYLLPYTRMYVVTCTCTCTYIYCTYINYLAITIHKRYRLGLRHDDFQSSIIYVVK